MRAGVPPSVKVVLVSTKCNDVLIRPLFPEQVMIHLNHYALGIPHVDPKIRKRTTTQQGPVDVSSSIVPGTNEFNYSERTDGFAFAVFVVRTYRAGEAEAFVKSSRTLPMDLALSCVRPSVANPTRCSIRARRAAAAAAKPSAASAGGAVAPSAQHGGAGGASASGAPVDDDDDDIVVATGVQIKVKDPVALIPIQTPARGVDCNHIQCFDLAVFAKFNSKPSSKFRCPFCQIYLPLNDVWVDPVVQRLLVQVREQDGKTGNTDGTFVPGRGVPFEDVTHVELQADGSWVAVVPGKEKGAGAGAGAGASDGVSAGAGTGAGAGAEAFAPSRDPNPSRKRKRAAAPAPEIVSLLSDSDDEPPPPAPSAAHRARLSLQQNGSGPRAPTYAMTAPQVPRAQPRSSGPLQVQYSSASTGAASNAPRPPPRAIASSRAPALPPVTMAAPAPTQAATATNGHDSMNGDEGPDWADLLAMEDEDWMNL